MHIPDGFLDARTASITAGLSAAGVGWAARSVRRSLSPSKVPLLGLTAAFVFAAQMVNFPVAGGTSGHLLGGTLAAVLLGPSGGILVLATVLITQCLLFADGGLLSIGANVFNMGIIGTASAYAVYWLVRRGAKGLRGQLAAAAIAAWCSVVLASIACAAELALSGTARWGIAVPAMAGIHGLIGVGEAVITMLVLAAIAAARPDLLRGDAGRPHEPRRSGVIVYGMLIALGLALLVAPFASPLPDGLEKVGARLGFMGKAAANPLVRAPIAGYSIPGIASPAVATAIGGGIGAIVMFAFVFLLGRFVVPGPVRDARVSAGGGPDSPVHRAPAGVKLACALVLLLATILAPVPHPIVFAWIALVLVAIAAWSRIQVVLLGRCLLVLEPFVLGIAVLSLLQPGGPAIFLRLLVRGTLCLFTILLLSSTTPFAEILGVMRRLRLPSILITMLALLYRYLFLLVEEAERMSRARACRTFRRDPARLWRIRGGVVGSLFVRSADRAERVHAAMTARGWKA